MNITVEINNPEIEFKALQYGDWFVKDGALFMRTNTGNGNAISLDGPRRSLYNTFGNDVEVRRVTKVSVTLE